jgi:hypothetical protein
MKTFKEVKALVFDNDDTKAKKVVEAMKSLGMLEVGIVIHKPETIQDTLTFYLYEVAGLYPDDISEETIKNKIEKVASIGFIGWMGLE